MVYVENFKKKNIKALLNYNDRFGGIQFIAFETDKSSSCGTTFEKPLDFQAHAYEKPSVQTFQIKI